MPWMYYRYPNAGTLRLSGRDRLAFLNNLTTHRLDALSRERAVLTVLTNAAGRILDLLIVLEDDHESLLVLALPGRGEATLAYFHSQIKSAPGTVPLAALRKTSVRYQITLSDESRLWDHAILLPGEGALPPGLQPPGPPGQAQRFPNGSAAISLPDVLGGGLLLLHPRGVTVMMLARSRLLSPETFTYERVRRGILGADTELTAEFSPFEVGLGSWVDIDKPDFPGRTILAYAARQPERSRTIVGMRLTSPVMLPATVRRGEEQIGHLTSVATAGDGAIALAAVRRPFDRPGTHVTVHSAAGAREDKIPATVTALPIPDLPETP